MMIQRNLIAALLTGGLLTLPAHAQNAEVQTFGAAGGTPQVLWSLPIGEEDSDDDEVDGIAVDDGGNVAISGIMRGGLRLGGEMMAARGQGDIFLARYGADGGLQWKKAIGGSGDDNAFDLQMDGSGNIIISGWFAGQVDFGGTTLQSQGGQDMFLAKYAPNGALVWAQNFGGRGEDGGNELSVLSNGEIAVSAMSDGGFAINGQTYDGGGERDAFLLRVSSGGALIWALPFAGPGTERIRGVSMNDAGEVFVGFQYRGSVSNGTTTVQARGGWDGAVAKVSANGQGQWLLPVGGNGTDNVRGIAAGPSGSVYAAGVFEGPATMAGQEVPSIGKKGDDFLMQLTSAGELAWLNSAGGAGPGTGTEIRADSRGVVVSGLIATPLTVRHNRDKIAQFTSPSGLPTSYLAGFTPGGDLRFVYSPSPSGKGSGAMGDVLKVSPNGRYAVQALRFRGTLSVAGRAMQTPSKKDSAIILFQLNGA